MTTPIIFERADMVEQQVERFPFAVRWVCWSGVALFAMAQVHAEEMPVNLQGDVGLGAYYTHSIMRDKSDALAVLPYADFKYQRLFARVDTVGVKTLKMGYGHLELVGRFRMDGFKANTPALQGLVDRDMPIPMGIGTLQVTPMGGIMLNAFHDVGRSQGDLIEAIYGAAFELPRVTVYPLLGVEYLSREYVRYYYGISQQEAAISQYAFYQPNGALNSHIGFIADIKLTDEYHLNFYGRHKWLGDSIQLSPIVTQRYLDTAYLALSYRFR